MAVFRRTLVTKKGHELIAKLTAGTADIKFTRVCVSDYDYSRYSDNQLEQLTSLNSIKQETTVGEVTVVNNSTVKVRVSIENTELKQGYYLRTIGLYAKYNDAEILYSVTSANISDYIPAYNNTTHSGININLLTTTSNAENVNIEVDPSAKVTLETFNEFKDEVNTQLNENTQQIFEELIKIDDYVGLTIHNTINIDLANLYKDYKFKILRTGIQWSVVEKTKGVYDFSSYESQISIILDSGLVPLVHLGYQDSVYLTNGKNMVDLDVQNAYVNFVKATVSHFKDKKILWQLINEPDLSVNWTPQTSQTPVYYGQLLEKVYNAIRSNDTSGKILAPVISQYNLSWFENACKNGILNFLDYVSIHFYTPDIPEKIENYFIKIKAIINKYSNRNIPIILDECGYSTVPSWDNKGNTAVVDEETRIKYLPRLMMLGLKNGIKNVIFYEAIAGQRTNTNCEEWFGIFNKDYSPTDSAIKIKNIMTELNGFYYAGEITSSSDYDYILKFVDKNFNFKYVFWTTNTSHNMYLNDKLYIINDTIQIVDSNYELKIEKYNYGNDIVNNLKNIKAGIRDNSNGGEIFNDYDTNFAIDNGHAENRYNVAGMSCHSEGARNVAFGGVLLTITSYDSTNKTITLNEVPSTLTIDSQLAIKADWDNSLIVNVTSINDLVIGVTITPKSTWKYAIVKSSNKYGCHAEGTNNISANMCSHSEGQCNLAIGNNSHSEGAFTCALADNSHSAGYNTKASNYASNVCGKYNKEMNINGDFNNQIGDVFVIGNGTSSTNRSNAFRVTYTGSTYGLSAFNASGADFAEFHEWEDGNLSNEDRIGYFVTNAGKQIKKATKNDFVLGIISGNPCLVGNSDEDWQGRYLKDEFGRFVYEDVEEEIMQKNEIGETILVKTGNIIKNGRLKLNNEYDDSLEYKERKDRQEWDYVCKRGMIAVRDDGSCEVGKWCKCNDDSVATITDIRGFDTYMVLERINENVILIEFK